MSYFSFLFVGPFVLLIFSFSLHHHLFYSTLLTQTNIPIAQKNPTPLHDSLISTGKARSPWIYYPILVDLAPSTLESTN